MLSALAVGLVLNTTVGWATIGPPMPGVLYTDTTSAMAVVSDVKPTKTGRACARSVLGLIGFGDAGIEAARKAGDIDVIASVDIEITAVLLIYTQRCTIVRGR